VRWAAGFVLDPPSQEAEKNQIETGREGESYTPPRVAPAARRTPSGWVWVRPIYSISVSGERKPRRRSAR
jgi:hypothetical protein